MADFAERARERPTREGCEYSVRTPPRGQRQKNQNRRHQIELLLDGDTPQDRERRTRVVDVSSPCN